MATDAAAERSAHVTRGDEKPAAGPDPFVGPEFGPVKLRAVAELEAKVERLRAEAARWKAQAFAPLGDNHHNALLCPHCNPEGRRFA